MSGIVANRCSVRGADPSRRRAFLQSAMMLDKFFAYAFGEKSRIIEQEFRL